MLHSEIVNDLVDVVEEVLAKLTNNRVLVVFCYLTVWKTINILV